MKSTFLVVPFALLITTVSAHAATLTSSTFVAEGLTATKDIDVTGPNVVDWGYYDYDGGSASGDFSSSTAFENSKAVPAIGAVTVAPGAVDGGAFGNNPFAARLTMTFDDGTSPGSGTVSIGSGFGAWGGTEDNAGTFVFNDLGVGTHTVQLYVGHGNNDRVFDMDYSVTASDGDLSGNTISNSIASGDLYATYEIVFSTTDALADLTLTFNSNSGGIGSGVVAGYVVESVVPVPEPNAMMLVALAFLGLVAARWRLRRS